MNKVYKIAFIPNNSSAHLKPFLSLAKRLRVLGHKCVFVVNNSIKDEICGHGFESECYEQNEKGASIGRLCTENMMKMSSFDKIRNISLPFIDLFLQRVKNSYNEIKRIIEDLKPDAIVVDKVTNSPAVVSAGVPWITLITANPLESFNDMNLPPYGSGYAMNSDRKLWDEFRREIEDAFYEIWQGLNSWLRSVNMSPLTQKGKFYFESPFLNLYSYPKELDYYENETKGKNWVSFDSWIECNVENETKGFEIPQKLRERSGKLIYISMGTIGCNEIILMKRLVSLLSNSKHRFIISQGLLANKYQLPDNMWGQNWLPQIQVLPIVDLVLTHGGNNTFIECLYFAKPMIVLPLFVDQYDNAQRIVDKGLGVRLDPYLCTQSELFESIEQLLNDSDLKKKYENISRRMKDSKSREMSAKLIEDLITDYKSE